MFTFRFLTGFGTATGSWSTVSVLLPFAMPDGDRLLAGSTATGIWHLLALTSDRVDLLSSHLLADPSGTYMLEDATLVTLAGQMRLYSASRTGSWIDVQAIGPGGGTLTDLAPLVQVGGVAMAVSAIGPLQLGSQTFLAITAHDRGTFEILQLSATAAPRLDARAADSPKATLDGVSDIVADTRATAGGGDARFLRGGFHRRPFHPLRGSDLLANHERGAAIVGMQNQGRRVQPSAS